MARPSDSIAKTGQSAGPGPSAKADSGPVYPFSVDVPSMPERKYIAGIYALARASFVSIAVSVALCAALAVRALSISVSPYFIYWSAPDQAFRMMARGSDPAAPKRFLNQDEYLAEWFAREYVKRTFEISPTLADNEAGWCECSGGKGAAPSPFDPLAECFVCNFSSPQVYASFVASQKPAFMKLASAGASRRVVVSGMELVRRGSPPKDDSIFALLLDAFFRRQSATPVYTEYKIDFTLEDRAGARSAAEPMRAYMLVYSLLGNLNSYKVADISYMFRPKTEAP